MYKYYVYENPMKEIEKLYICEKDGKLVCVEPRKEAVPEGASLEETPLIKGAARQLSEYFAGKRKAFDLPLAPEGTDFQKRVWEELTKIPYGETRSYGELAAALGNPRAARAVGMANNRNHLMIVIPCHRVIGADGSLTGFGGGLGMKRALLALEGALAPRD